MDRQETEQFNRQLKEILDQLKDIHEAFPDGPLAHRQSHEAMIKAARAQEKFWNELKLDVAKKGTWALLIILCGLLVVGITTKLGIGVSK